MSLRHLCGWFTQAPTHLASFSGPWVLGWVCQKLLYLLHSSIFGSGLLPLMPSFSLLGARRSSRGSCSLCQDGSPDAAYHPSPGDSRLSVAQPEAKLSLVSTVGLMPPLSPREPGVTVVFRET